MTPLDEIATAHAIDPVLVTALTRVESDGNPWAWNPEPKYRYFWDVSRRAPFRAVQPDELLAKTPPPDFPTLRGDRDQEWWGQQASWGLMQIMGGVARERGFIGPYLTELCDPTVNLTYGCAYLATLLVWSHGNLRQALAAYNGGKGGNEVPPYRNQAYVDRVFKQARASQQVPR